ncbi:MAG: hypothetical protein HF300_04200 [Ignavibacteria bacterium]|jgi:hypothetical protein|nr:hypothetical protein [Ignavibacteria bacterium]MCU7497978.1 hypothetical protein [Ignavibacteria bacterium]MCU7511736.1 hypothetical protein [Ignavibacteria bacterium]MCU7519810.1 hypothetical protein [Ignavibacteria bacterium]MCU7523692.1 hypothetical protein [Ignavibacteria bacterium]
MLRKYFFVMLGLAFCLLSGSAHGQEMYKDFSLSLNYNYTTTARIFLNPKSPDEILRNNSFYMEDIFSPSADLRYRLTEDILIGLNVEYIKKVQAGPNLTVLGSGGTQTIIVEDGFKVIPFELSAYYILPFSTEKFKFIMGGGLAYYYGEHLRKFGDEEVSNLKREFAYGIQALVSSDYMITSFLSLRGEMKFRDPELEVTSKYKNKRVNYEGSTIVLAQDTFQSKINIDGVTFTLGMAFHF